MTNNTLTALNGVKVGHSTHLDKLTGCTVVLFDQPYTVAYKSYGGAPGTFNTDSLLSGKTSYKENAIFIAGGSITGLMTGASIIEELRNNKKGSCIGDVYNPSVTGAIVFDLGMRVAPYDSLYGTEAYRDATSDPVQGGNVGAGTGVSVGKFQWLEKGTKSGAMKTGVGSARVDLGNGVIVTAMTVLNALGNVILPNGEVLAGNRDENKKFKNIEDRDEFITQDQTNTTISIVGINVDLKSKEHYEKIAHFASQGHVRAINPVHTSSDGDTVFVFSTGEIKDPLNNMGKYFSETDNDIHLQVDVIGNAAAKAVQESVYDACRQAGSIKFADSYKGIIPNSKDYS